MVSEPESTRETKRVNDLRAQLPVTATAVYLNTGTCGPMPTPALAAMQQALERDAVDGRIYMTRFSQVGEQLGCTRAAIASLLGAGAHEIALTNRTSDGLNIVLWGMSWRPGDEILTTGDEHPGLLVPLAALHQRFGVQIRYIPTGAEGQEPDGRAAAIVERFARAIGPRTRLIAVSHVLWSNGDVLPLQELARLAHDAGARILIDGAQAAGAIPVNVRELEVDYYALPGQKWLCGPEGTGALFVAEEALPEVEPTFTGYASVTDSEPLAPVYTPAPGARRYEVGMPLPAAFAGLEAALQWLRSNVDINWAATRIDRLATKLRQDLTRIPGVEVLTPAPARAPMPGQADRNMPTSGLITFRVRNRRDHEMLKHLFDQGFQLRTLPPPLSGIRASVGFFNTEAELDGLVDAVERLIAS